MDDLIIEKLKEMALEWEQYECNHDSSEWSDGCETGTYRCAEQLLDFLEENTVD